MDSQDNPVAMAGLVAGILAFFLTAFTAGYYSAGELLQDWGQAAWWAWAGYIYFSVFVVLFTGFFSSNPVEHLVALGLGCSAIYLATPMVISGDNEAHGQSLLLALFPIVVYLVIAAVKYATDRLLKKSAPQ